MNIYRVYTYDRYENIEVELIDKDVLRILSTMDGMTVDAYLDLKEFRTKIDAQRSKKILVAYNNDLFPIDSLSWSNLASWPHDYVWSAPIRIFLPSDLSTLEDALIEIRGDESTKVKIMNSNEIVPVLTDDELYKLRQNFNVSYRVISGAEQLKSNDISNYEIEFYNAFGPVPAYGRLTVKNTAGYVSNKEFLMNGNSRIKFSLRALDLVPGDNINLEFIIRTHYINRKDKDLFTISIVE